MRCKLFNFCWDSKGSRNIFHGFEEFLDEFSLNHIYLPPCPRSRAGLHAFEFSSLYSNRSLATIGGCTGSCASNTLR
jgi:hypothetical protein